MEKLFSSHAYVAWLRVQAAARRPYWYGTIYQPCTESLLQYKRKQYPTHYGESRMPRYRQDIAAGQICGDCVNGAVKGAAWSDLGAHDTIYKSHGIPDVSADGMFAWCKQLGADWGPISTLPERPGVALRCSGHVGVYIGDGLAVEWRGFKYGCVITRVKDRSWTHWYVLPWVDYGEGTAPAPEAEALLGGRLLKAGKTGADVRELQRLLTELGFEPGTIDGDFGPKTEAAVRRMQTAAGIDVDGEYGSESHTALMRLLASAEAAEDGGEQMSEDSGKVVRVTAAVAANIRAGAGKQFDILTCAPKGRELPWTATAANGWLGVRLPEGIGWIAPTMAEVIGA